MSRFSERGLAHPPFAWFYCPATERTLARISVVIHKHAHVWWDQRQHVRVAGVLPVPIVEIYRVHSWDDVPLPDSPIDPASFIPPRRSFRDVIRARSEVEDSEARVRAIELLPDPAAAREEPLVSVLPAGVLFQRNAPQGAWSILVQSTRHTIPSSFIWDILQPRPGEPWEVRVVRTSDVRVTLEYSTDATAAATMVHYLERVVDSPSDVPRPGTSLHDRSFFRPASESSPNVTITLNFPPHVQALLTAFEIAFGSVPVLGDLYDVMDFIQSALSGEDLLGRPVGTYELCFMAVALLVCIGPIPPPRILRRLFPDRVGQLIADPVFAQSVAMHIRSDIIEVANRAPNGSISPVRRRVLEAARGEVPTSARFVDETLSLLNDAIREFRTLAITERMPSVVRDLERSGKLTETVMRCFDGPSRSRLSAVDLELWRVPRESQNAIFDALQSYRAGVITAEEFIDAFHPNFAAAFGEVVEHAELRRIFSEDLSGFRVEPLRTMYQSYVNVKTRRGLPARNAAQWALAQRSGGAPFASLEVALGRNFDTRIRRSAREALAADVDATSRAFFDQMHATGRAVQPYRDLVGARAGYGLHFDADHLLEKRFLKAHRIRVHIADEDALYAILMPRDARVARSLGSPHAYYDHVNKTQLMRQLIPYGEEDLFSLQQWWDAHVWTYTQLGVPRSVFGPPLEEMMGNLSRRMNERVEFRYAIEGDLESFYPARVREGTTRRRGG